VNEGLEADAAEARAAAVASEECAEAVAPPPALPLELFPDELDDGAAPVEDTDGLLAKPPHSTEVFVSGLARTTSEEELRAWASPQGELHELRLLVDAATGANRGYAFLSFRRREDAAAAAEALNGCELKGRKLRVALSPSKHRLFLGGLPKERFAADNLQRVLRGAGCVGVEAVEVPRAEDASAPTGTHTPGGSQRSRGFAFVDFFNTACAEKARRALSAPQFSLRGRHVSASWAEARPDEADVHAQQAATKSVYVANIPLAASPEALKAAFEQFGDVERVVIPPPKAVAAPSSAAPRARYGFVHFAERSSALAAVDAPEKPVLEGVMLELSLAKPEQRNAQHAAMQPHLPPVVGAAVAAATMGRGGMGAGGIGRRGGAYGQQMGMMPHMPQMAPQMPMVPPGMSLAPVMMPNGQMGYIMQPAGGAGFGMPQGMPPGYPPQFQGHPGGQGGRGWGRGGPQGGRHGDRYRPY